MFYVLALNKVVDFFICGLFVFGLHLVYWLQLLVSPAMAIQHVLFPPRVNGEQTKDDRSNLDRRRCW